jgi:hypothetical protein
VHLFLPEVNCPILNSRSGLTDGGWRGLTQLGLKEGFAQVTFKDWRSEALMMHLGSSAKEKVDDQIRPSRT